MTTRSEREDPIGGKKDIPKRIKSVKCICLSMLCVGKHIPKKVNSITKVLSRYNFVCSHEVRKITNLGEGVP